MRLTLLAKKEETSDTTSFIFKPDTEILWQATLEAARAHSVPLPLTWQAGQFLHYTLPHPDADDRKTQRYFTISSAPYEEHIMLTTRLARLDSPSSARRAGEDRSSTFKKALFNMKVGGVIEADGLEGDFTLVDPEQDHVFIAGGIGITPYRAILLDLDHKNLSVNVTLLYANKDKNNVVFRDELEALVAKHPTFKIHYFFNPERIDEAAIKKIVPDIARPIFYVSGPEIMVEAFEKMLPRMGVPEDHIKKDYFPGYNWP